MPKRAYLLTSRDVFHLVNSMFDRSFAFKIQGDIARFSRSAHGFYMSDVSPAEILLDFCAFRYNFLKKDENLYV